MPRISEQNTCLPGAQLFYLCQTSNFTDRGQKWPFWLRLAFNPKFNFLSGYFFGLIKLYCSTVKWAGMESSGRISRIFLSFWVFFQIFFWPVLIFFWIFFGFFEVWTFFRFLEFFIFSKKNWIFFWIFSVFWDSLQSY